MSTLQGHPLADFVGPIGPGQIDPNTTMLPKLREANIVIGRDVVSGKEFVVYGRDVLTEIAHGGSPEQRPLCIEIDPETNELDVLLAMVRVAKGRDDYRTFNQ